MSDVLNLDVDSAPAFLADLGASEGLLAGLRSLAIVDAGLDELPVALLGRLKSIRHLDLSGNRLAVLPHEIGLCRTLETLVVNGNSLHEFPFELLDLPALRKIEAKDNLVVRLPNDIGRAPALETLILTGNRLDRLPLSLGDLATLRVLHLDNNQLRHVPESLVALTALVELRLEYNQLSRLPHDLRAMTRLRELSLEGNGFPEPEIERIGMQLPRCSIF